MTSTASFPPVCSDPRSFHPHRPIGVEFPLKGDRTGEPPVSEAKIFRDDPWTHVGPTLMRAASRIATVTVRSYRHAGRVPDAWIRLDLASASNLARCGRLGPSRRFVDRSWTVHGP